MQIDVDDALRGHVFAVQDALFWMSFILALTRRRRSSLPTAGHPGSSSPGRRSICVGLAAHAFVVRRAQAPS